MKLRDLGEKGILNNIVSEYVDKPWFDEHLGFPDDVRDLLPNGPRILFSIDGYAVENVMLPWRSWSDIGWCIVTSVVSDHVVKGGVPRDLVVSLGLKPDMLLDDLVDLFKGLREAVDYYGLRLLGGDLNGSNTPWIDVALLSYTSVKKPPRRCCGRPGDHVLVVGVYGAMGYVVFHGVDEAGKHDWVVKATRRPRTYVELATVIASYYRSIHASMDVSDGLGYTLLEMINHMRYGVEMHDKPIYHSELDGLCSDEECFWKYLLNGGEEYGAVLFVDERMVDQVMELMVKFGIPVRDIGRVVDRSPHIYLDGREIDHLVKYWDQFSGWR